MVPHWPSVTQAEDLSRKITQPVAYSLKLLYNLCYMGLFSKTLDFFRNPTVELLVGSFAACSSTSGASQRISCFSRRVPNNSRFFMFSYCALSKNKVKLFLVNAQYEIMVEIFFLIQLVKNKVLYSCSTQHTKSTLFIFNASTQRHFLPIGHY